MSDRDALIAPHIPALRRYAWALCRRSAHDSDDLVQDCLMRALGHWHLRRAEGSVRAWLFTILHNQFVSLCRQEARRPRTDPLHEADGVGTAPAQPHASHLTDVATALETLPDEQRAVLLLVGVEDLSYEDAAQALGIPVGTVMSRLSRGRERLRQMVDGTHPVALRRIK